jgi:hypothetical protein
MLQVGARGINQPTNQPINQSINQSICVGPLQSVYVQKVIGLYLGKATDCHKDSCDSLSRSEFRYGTLKPTTTVRDLVHNMASRIAAANNILCKFSYKHAYNMYGIFPDLNAPHNFEKKSYITHIFVQLSCTEYMLFSLASRLSSSSV